MKKGGTRVLKDRLEEIFNYLKKGYPVYYLANQLRVDHSTIIYHRKKWIKAEIETLGMSSFPKRRDGQCLSVTELPPLNIEPVKIVTSNYWKKEFHCRTERQINLAKLKSLRQSRRLYRQKTITYFKSIRPRGSARCESAYIDALLKSSYPEEEKKRAGVLSELQPDCCNWFDCLRSYYEYAGCVPGSYHGR